MKLSQRNSGKNERVRLLARFEIYIFRRSVLRACLSSFSSSRTRTYAHRREIDARRRA
ncbi:hypothetical protein TSAR_013979 [Trichomalopsis sarcophagae]|uniref:Uncharacterized protein n=1 Tax=Trichomalopsis sarcophagae TaxID=543379 RepID=A0A232ESB5_9HYME|nr:hypothetical protein TSAR_013979 [Trichomalopsis sarcophagae]